MKKEVLLPVRITRLEKAALERLSQLEDLNRSDLVRMLIRDAAKEAGIWRPLQNEREALHGKPA